MVNPTPLSLYFHIPFCRKKCPYCHFYVIPYSERHSALLLSALKQEIERISPHFPTHEIVSIYFGGGTPSLFGPKPIETLLNSINEIGNVSPDCEITLEANPEDITKDLMQGYRAAGINRASIGVQALHDENLLQIGRGHNSNKAIDGIHTTFNAGIENISIDVMYELPNQTKNDFRQTLQAVDELPISHLSLYNMTIEPGTAFYKQTLTLPSEEENFTMLQEAVASLNSYGLKRYEISAFAKPGKESKHNVGYWTARPFFGLGPSAFSYFNQSRFRNVANLNRYVKAMKENQSAIDFSESLPYPASQLELLAVELRLVRGVDLAKFNLPKDRLVKLDTLKAEGFLEQTGSMLKLSEKGLLFYDTVASEII